jgi:hypothetical protein
VAGLDASGVPRWASSFGGPGYDDARAIAADGNRVLAAVSIDDASGPAPAVGDAGSPGRDAPRRADIMCLDPGGNLVAVRSFTSKADVTVHALALDARRGLVLAGEADAPASFEGASLGKAGAFVAWASADPPHDASTQRGPGPTPSTLTASESALIRHSTRHRHRGFLSVELCLVDDGDKPRARVPFEVRGGPSVIKGATDDKGCLKFEVPASVRHPQVVLPKDPRRDSFDVAIGNMEPIDDDAGVRDRLDNLGYGESRAGDSESFRAVVTQFQSARGLPQTGRADLATQAALQLAHGN